MFIYYDFAAISYNISSFINEMDLKTCTSEKNNNLCNRVVGTEIYIYIFRFITYFSSHLGRSVYEIDSGSEICGFLRLLCVFSLEVKNSIMHSGKENRFSDFVIEEIPLIQTVSNTSLTA